MWFVLATASAALLLPQATPAAWRAAGARGCARLPALPQMQQGPLEDGFKELLPLSTDEGNVDPELVERMEREVQQLTGVGLEGLLNPSKVVNCERERVLLESQLAQPSLDAETLAQLEAKLDKVEKDLYREKRTIFRGWLKNLFVGQSLTAVILSGVLVFDAIPGVSVDLSLRALGFWSYWLFIIPSLRARRPTGWEKKALNAAFLGSPIATLGLPFVTKQPADIWEANLILLVACYAYGYLSGDSDNVGGFSGPLRWLDFGSGQERGMSMEQREKFAAKKAEASEKASEAEKEPVP